MLRAICSAPDSLVRQVSPITPPFVQITSMQYLPQLDGLRGVAIVAVMLFHAGISTFGGGFIGVDIFFVLSGFLITTLLVREYQTHGSVSLRNFYMRRALRLLPALLILLLVFCLLSFIRLDSTDARSNYVGALIVLFYLSNWARALSLHPQYPLDHTWSLSIEEQFYVLWPVILILMLTTLKKPKHVLALTVCFALAAWCLRVYLTMSGSTVERIYYGSDTRADSLMAGCALGIFYDSQLWKELNVARFGKYITVLAIFCGLGLLVFVCRANWRQAYMYYAGFLAVEIFTVIVLIEMLTNTKGLICAALQTRLIVWVGSISYGLYLWHYPIFRLVRSQGYETWIIATAGSAITFIVASISYHFLERPLLRLRRYFVHEKPGAS